MNEAAPEAASLSATSLLGVQRQRGQLTPVR
jgi:hypothetical protein